MDSLLANYASEEEEEEEEDKQQQQQQQQKQKQGNIDSSFPSKSTSFNLDPPQNTSLFSSLPPPKTSSSSLFSSLPPPKSHQQYSPNTITPSSDQTHKPSSQKNKVDAYNDNIEKQSSCNKPFSLSLPKLNFDSNPTPKTSFSIFSSLPPPRSISNQTQNNLMKKQDDSESHPQIPSNPSRIVQFKPPINPSILERTLIGSDDEGEEEDDEEEEDDDNDDQVKERKTIKETPSSTLKSLSSILPPPSKSLGVAPPRRSGIEFNVPASSSVESTSHVENIAYVNYDNSAENWVGTTGGASSDANYSSWVDCGSFGGHWGDGSSTVALETPVGIPSSKSYASYVNYTSYEGNWVDTSALTMASGESVSIEGTGKTVGKRGRNEIPAEVVEVKQDELMRNRPREDQVKLTGIAFGPSYQPAPSANGKPTKLHKRKHQIGSLYYDMRQRELELSERRARGLVTKAQTQAKYGW